MPQPKNLGRVISRFSEGKTYDVIDTITNTRFLLRADIQQTKAPFWQRMMGDTNVNAQITILVPYNHMNPILEGNNRYAINFNGTSYTITERLDAGRTGFIQYNAIAQIQG